MQMIIQYILNKILNFKWERGRVMVSYDGPVPPHLKLSSYPSALRTEGAGWEGRGTGGRREKCGKRVCDTFTYNKVTTKFALP